MTLHGGSGGMFDLRLIFLLDFVLTFQQKGLNQPRVSAHLPEEMKSLYSEHLCPVGILTLILF